MRDRPAKRLRHVVSRSALASSRSPPPADSPPDYDSVADDGSGEQQQQQQHLAPISPNAAEIFLHTLDPQDELPSWIRQFVIDAASEIPYYGHRLQQLSHEKMALDKRRRGSTVPQLNDQSLSPSPLHVAAEISLPPSPGPETQEEEEEEKTPRMRPMDVDQTDIDGFEARITSVENLVALAEDQPLAARRIAEVHVNLELCLDWMFRKIYDSDSSAAGDSSNSSDVRLMSVIYIISAVEIVSQSRGSWVKGGAFFVWLERRLASLRNDLGEDFHRLINALEGQFMDALGKVVEASVRQPGVRRELRRFHEALVEAGKERLVWRRSIRGDYFLVNGLSFD